MVAENQFIFADTRGKTESDEDENFVGNFEFTNALDVCILQVYLPVIPPNVQPYILSQSI
jgi:hypothetical protein